MAGSTSKKNRTKSREQKKKAFRRQSAQQARREKADFYFDDAMYYLESGNHEKAEAFLKKSLKRNPDNRDALFELIRLGDSSQNYELIEKGLLQLYERNLLNNTPHENKMVLLLCQYLLDSGNFIRAGQICEDLLARRKTLNLENPKDFRERLNRIISYTNAMLELQENTPETRTESRQAKQKSKAGRSRSRTAESGKKAAGMQTDPFKSREPAEAAPAPPAAENKSTPEIPITLEIGEKGIAEGFAGAEPASKEHYDLVMDAVRLRFKETFDHLLCLSTLNGIASLEYQEETARKVLKTFRGRAMLADEVGMGKTIEAAIVVKEYLMRRMIRNVLVLAPTPLVSQWREELSSKFGLAFVSTDDRDFKASDESFWQQPFIVASINIAKSKKNFSAVADRQWDMVVADEAHHFKNRNTLNWKLLNAMKKRFLLMLTATPVENNLMELYNLITLLKPGQLKTASAFKEEFMTRGDPTDPRNRTRLKGLLEQVMIRNTRAVSNVRIPPRFAETIRTDPSDPEAELYRRVSDLVRGINASNGSRRQATLKHLLAEAGSSPAALEKTISELAEKHDLTDHHHIEIQEILNLISSMEDTGKNRTVLHLTRSTDEKIIIFVKYRATLDHLSGLLTRNKVAHSLFHGQM
ncbi:MAG: SNF2-related protein, partial [Desulfosalsimonas sp.]